MAETNADGEWLGTLDFPADTVGFDRTLSLSDAVFAIAMTLLVLTLEIPDVTGDHLATALVEQLPQLVAFIVSFGFVANVWWQHQKIVHGFARMEPGLIGLNLALLGAVALVPFPTILVGTYPTEQTAVLALIGIFLVLNVLWLLLVGRAQWVDAWIEPMPTAVWYWHIVTWAMGVFALLVIAVVAVISPTAALLLLAISIIVGPFAARLAYPPLDRQLGR